MNYVHLLNAQWTFLELFLVRCGTRQQTRGGRCCHIIWPCAARNSASPAHAGVHRVGQVRSQSWR
jgi:hypothetical protein